MVCSSKLQPKGRISEARQTHQGNKVHLWQFLQQLLSDDSCRGIISWSRKDRREFQLINPQEVAQRWGTFKQNKAMTYKQLSRDLRCYYQQESIKKVPGQRFVYKLSKRVYKYEPGAMTPQQAKSDKSAPPQRTTGSSFVDSFSPTTTPLEKLLVVPMSYCPLCLCPSSSYPLPTPESTPSATSIPVSVIQLCLYPK